MSQIGTRFKVFVVVAHCFDRGVFREQLVIVLSIQLFVALLVPSSALDAVSLMFGFFDTLALRVGFWVRVEDENVDEDLSSLP